MDILAHGLWAGTAAQAARRVFPRAKEMRALSVWRTALWGVIPDLLSFAPLFLWLAAQIISGHDVSEFIQRPDAAEPPIPDGLFIFHLTEALYNVSHSLVVIVAVIGVVFLLFRSRIFLRRFPWEIGGLLFHVLVDIPTHSYEFYPTPLLWPLSSWKFDGFSWGNPWFMLANYSVLTLIYLVFVLRTIRGRKRSA